MRRRMAPTLKEACIRQKTPTKIGLSASKGDSRGFYVYQWDKEWLSNSHVGVCACDMKKDLQKRCVYIKIDLQQKRPVYIKRDPQKEICIHQKGPTQKETCIPQKRPSNETCVHQNRPTKETYMHQWDLHKRPICINETIGLLCRSILMHTRLFCGSLLMYTGLYLWASFDVYRSVFVGLFWCVRVSCYVSMSSMHQWDNESKCDSYVCVCMFLTWLFWICTELIAVCLTQTRMHTHIHEHTHTNTHTHLRTHEYTHIHPYTYTHKHTDAHTHTCKHTRAHTHKHTKKKKNSRFIYLSLACSLNVYRMSIAFSYWVYRILDVYRILSMSIAFSYWVRRKFPLYRSLLPF